MPARGRGTKYHGSKWLRPEKRLALYLRDHLCCAWCGQALEEGAQLTIDHLVPVCHGGSNQADNLITACMQCNSSRGKRDIAEFADAVASYLNRGMTAALILAHINRQRTAPVPLQQAKALIAARGGYTAALKAHVTA